MAGTEPKKFFQQKRSAAEVKEEILARFFPVWGELALSGSAAGTTKECLLVDLYAGKAGAEADTPACSKILKSIFASTGARPNLNAACHTFLGETNKVALAALEEHVRGLWYYPELLHPPVFLKDLASLELLQNHLQAKTPALVVTDPFGSKQSQQIMQQVLEKEGSDLFLLFEPAKLKASVKASEEDGPVNSLYGSTVEALRAFYVRNQQAQKREDFTLKCLELSLQERTYQTLTFKICLPGKEQPYQYLLLASITNLACTKLKEILLDFTDYQEDGVPQMGANVKPVRLLVPEFAKYLPFSVHNLVLELLQEATQYNRLSLEKIYEKHNVHTHYSKANYLTACEKLKELGKILLINPKTGQQVHKLSYDCLIKFIG